MNLAYSDAPIDVLSDAYNEALRTGSWFIEIDHLILAILHYPESLACELLRRSGIEIDEMKKEIELKIHKGQSIPYKDIDKVKPGRSTIALLALVVKGSATLLDKVDPTKLLLKACQVGDGFAVAYLRSKGVDFEKLDTISRKIEPKQPEYDTNYASPKMAAALAERLSQLVEYPGHVS